MTTVDTVVVGAGHAGLAMSAFLAAQGRDHVVLDRGRIGERWRSERWDSLRLLTPNWTIRLPGFEYRGPDPDGYLSARGLADLLAGYARAFDLPVLDGVAVHRVEPAGEGFAVVTAAETWRAANVVVATGACDVPAVPAVAAGAEGLTQVTASTYRNPAQLPDGEVLVVGASASGVQIADELSDSGRDVVLAAGTHTRVPRRYRGMDIVWWLEAIGALDRSIDDMPDRARARREPSLQLVGRRGARLDLGTLAAKGVRVTGRLVVLDSMSARFDGSLTESAHAAETRLRALLGTIDDHAAASGLASEVDEPDPPPPLALAEGPERIDLAGVSTVIWATGYRRDHRWLPAAALDETGELHQHYGITPLPGLFTVGQRFQTRRNSTFVGGSRHDAALVAAHLDAVRPVRRRPGLPVRRTS